MKKTKTKSRSRQQGPPADDASGPVFRCVHCMAPSSSTHRAFGREIKLTTCPQCGLNVDPYVEREWLLVAMDCMLLREEAYRHVLANRTATSGPSVVPLLQGALVAAAVHAYVLLQDDKQSTIMITSEESNGISLLGLLFRQQEQLPWVLPALAMMTWWVGSALLGLGIFYACYVLSFLLSRRQDANNLSTAITGESWWERHRVLASAIVLPNAFHGLTLLVMIWENATTVRCLGSLLVLYYQYMASSVAIQLYRDNDNHQRHRYSRALFRSAFASGLLLRALWNCLLAATLWKRIMASMKNDDHHHHHDHYPMPCIVRLELLSSIVTKAVLEWLPQPLIRFSQAISECIPNNVLVCLC